MKRIAFYGGSFDPVHLGHLAIARTLLPAFRLDKFIFIPAFHAPHKLRRTPTSPYDRFTMLCLATQRDRDVTISRIELEMPERPYSVETLSRITEELPDDDLFFVMGADSWMDITTWREWERVLALTNHIVVTRPGTEIGTGHVTNEIRERIVDLRGDKECTEGSGTQKRIYLTDAVQYDTSATDIRRKIRENDQTWRNDVSIEVANYVEKYQIYK